MRGIQSARKLNEYFNRFGHRQGTAFNHVRERLPVHQLHDEEVDAIRLLNIVNCADVRMIESRKRPRFPLESPQILCVRRDFGGKHLDRHVAAEFGVAGAVHLAHPAAAERAEDPIGTDVFAVGKGHGWPQG